MNPIRVLAAAVVATSLMSVALKSGLSASPVLAEDLVALPASYVTLYQEIFAHEARAKRMTMTGSAGLSHVALRLWRQTGDPAYREKARDFFARTVSDFQFSFKDFHLLHHFGELAWAMKQEKVLSAEQESRLAALAIKELGTFCDSKDDGDNNIRIGQVAGYAGLRKFLEGTPLDRQADIDRRFDAYWSKIAAVGDLDEDASNYDSLGLAFLIDLARLLGREDDFRHSANFRRLFDRMRDIVSPTGLIPEYGDSYFTYSTCPLDRVYLLEYAAQLYGDPTYLFAAKKLYGRPSRGLPGADIWARALPLINLDRSTALPTAPSGEPSCVTYRRRFDQTADQIDKLILRTGREPGSAMIVVDVYAQGSHSHPEKGPSVAYYEAGGAPLFHNLGRHGTRSSVAGNLLFAMPASEPFPGCFNRPDVWTTMAIPVSYLSESPALLKADEQETWRQAHAGMRRAQHYLADSLSLRNFPEYNQGCEHLFFDNLRLSGPGGELLVDGFEAATGPGMAGWSKSILKEVAASSDHTEGQFSQRLNWSKLKGGPVRVFPLQPAEPEQPIDEQKYTHLKLDLKFTGKRPYMHIRGLGKQVDLGDQLLSALPKAARLEQRGHDAFGEIQYAAYVQGGCRATRRFVLTAEGYLMIQDEIVPGQGMAHWNAGQLWQIYELQAQGDGWFCSASDGQYPQAAERCLLVRYSLDEKTKSGVEAIEKRYHCPAPNGRPAKRFFTTYSVRPITARLKNTFAMIVVPQDPSGLVPAEAAAKIRIALRPDGTVDAEVSEAAGKKVKVAISANRWEVTR